MGVGDKDVRHCLATHSIKQRGDMCGIVGPGIDNGHLPPADDVTHGSLEGERARVVGQNTRLTPGAHSSTRPGARSSVLSN